MERSKEHLLKRFYKFVDRLYFSIPLCFYFSALKLLFYSCLERDIFSDGEYTTHIVTERRTK